MNNFKVGDIVKCIIPSEYGLTIVGNLYVIKNIDESKMLYFFGKDQSPYWAYSPQRFKIDISQKIKQKLNVI